MFDIQDAYCPYWLKYIADQGPPSHGKGNDAHTG